MGHQSPFYFVGLWFWKQIVGGTELALRMSSVLAVAAACVVLVFGVAKWAGSVVAGATAGLVLAVESNSLFFGTELRPYAFVIFFSSVALLCFLRLVALDSRHKDRPAWMGLIAAILLAMLCQPTAIGVLAWLPLVLCSVWLVRDRRELWKINLSDGLLLLGASAVGFALWRMTLGETWQQRSSWSSFAAATRVRQIWEVWDWSWLLGLPLVVFALGMLAATVRGRSFSLRQVPFATLLLALIAVAATSLFWIVSRADWIPVWHRRYFISILPIFACVAGGAMGVVEVASLPSRKAGTVAAFALVLTLLYQQGTLVRLRQYPVALVTRGEDWRSAIQWVRSNSHERDLFFLDAGLIEANTWLRRSRKATPKTPTPTLKQLEYLVFAVHGPYPAGRDAVPIDASGLPPEWRVVANVSSRSRRVFILTRRPANRVGMPLPPGSEIVGFGNLSVILQSSDLDRNF
jgi:hypothetical protein